MKEPSSAYDGYKRRSSLESSILQRLSMEFISHPCGLLRSHYWILTYWVIRSGCFRVALKSVFAISASTSSMAARPSVPVLGERQQSNPLIKGVFLYCDAGGLYLERSRF